MMKLRHEDREGYKARALESINVARMALGMYPIAELPKGEREQPCACPVSRALGEIHIGKFAVGLSRCETADKLGDAWDTSITRHRGRNTWTATVELPGVLKSFVKAFDEGDFPELEA